MVKYYLQGAVCGIHSCFSQLQIAICKRGNLPTPTNQFLGTSHVIARIPRNQFLENKKMINFENNKRKKTCMCQHFQESLQISLSKLSFGEHSFCMKIAFYYMFSLPTAFLYLVCTLEKPFLLSIFGQRESRMTTFRKPLREAVGEYFSIKIFIPNNEQR